MNLVNQNRNRTQAVGSEFRTIALENGCGIESCGANR